MTGAADAPDSLGPVRSSAAPQGRTLSELLVERRDIILGRWRTTIFDAYPPEAARFFRAERDAFRNPVGHSLLRGTQVIYDGLAAGSGAPVAEALEAIVRVRAVQALSAAEAIAFVFQLRRAIRDALPEIGSANALWPEVAVLDDRIDRLASTAFDLYSQCREQVYRIQADAARRGAASLIRQFQHLERISGPAATAEAERGPAGGCEP